MSQIHFFVILLSCHATFFLIEKFGKTSCKIDTVFSLQIFNFSRKRLPLLSKSELFMDIVSIQRDLMEVPFAGKQDIGVKVALFDKGVSAGLPTADIREGFVLICHSGTALFDYAHKSHTAHARDTIIVFPGDIYSLTSASADFTASWVSFTPQVMDEVLYNFPTSFFSHIADHPIYNLSDNEEYTNRIEYLKLLYARLADQSNICRYEIVMAFLRSLFMEILNRIVRNFSIDTSEPKHRRRLLDEFVNRVNSTPQCREVAYYADLLCITPKYLSAIVADGTGFTAKEFIDRAAITAIKQLLRTTDLSVKQIAERLDFSGSGNLCRFFKTNTGITISDFKRELKG